MRLLLLDVALGMLLLAAISAAASRPVRAARSSGRAIGWMLVCVPLPLAVALHLTLRLPQATDQAAFLAGVIAFAAGSALILSTDDDDWREEGGGEGPSWWPDFERDFHAYASRPPARREKVRSR